jgi:hypothetical protein
VPVNNAVAEAPLGPVSLSAVNFAQSPPLSDVARQVDQVGGRDEVAEATPDNGRVRQPSNSPSALAPTRDTVLQTATSNAMPAPIVNFDGISNTDNANFNPNVGRVSPPDTNGGVGPNHFVQFANLLMRVYDKTGNPLTPPFKMSHLFTALGGVCAANDEGDGIILYDSLADRWLVTQLGSVSLPYHECVGVSMTSDPTGGYFLYDFITPGIEFPDYPHFGVWPDGYYMTVNQFLGNTADGTGAYAFDRTKMLAGDPTAGLIYFNFNLTAHPEVVAGMLPSDFDGLIAPPAGRPNTFAYFTARTYFGDPADGLRLFDFHADFAVPANSTFTERPESSYNSPVPVAPFDPTTPAGRPAVRQPPPAQDFDALDSITDRLMHRLQYRNTGADERLVVTHTVGAPGSIRIQNFRAAPRYYELRRTLPGGTFAVSEQATFAPDTDNRWMGSAAEDNQGNMAVGYSVSSLTTFPSIRYAGRLFSDPPNGLFQGEGSIIAGSGVQLSSGNRWGDYSALTIDPTDDCTFWYTQEYYTAAGQASSTVGWQTRIASFRFPGCTAPAFGTLKGTVRSADGTPVSGSLVVISDGHSATSLADGTYSIRLSPGSYTVQALSPGNQCPPSSVTPVSVTNGGVTTSDAMLGGTPNVTFKSAVVTNGDGIIARNECNSLNVTLNNTCARDTGITSVLSTSTPGVTITQANSPYPDVAAGATTTNSVPFQVSTAPNFVCGTLINFVLTKTSANGMTAIPFSISSCGTSGQTINGSIGTGDLSEAGRVLRDGTGTSCGTSKVVSLIDSVSRHYRAYPFTNTGNSTACVTVNLTSVCNAQPVVYSGSFNPANPVQNYLADSGNSTAGGSTSFSFNVGAGQTFVLVVNEVDPGTGCSSYTGTVTGLPTDLVGSGFCGQACTINQPADVIAQGQSGNCGTTVNYPAPTSSGSCGTLTTNPASGTFFPVGTTKVTITASSSSATSSFNVSVLPAAGCPVVFTDDPLVARTTTVRAIHIVELRAYVNLMRSLAGLGPFTFSDGNLQGVPIKASHIMELRNALNPARAALGKPAITYARMVTTGMTVLANDIIELRNGVR